MKFWLRMSSMDTLLGGAVVSSLHGRAVSDKATEVGKAKLQGTWTLSYNPKWVGKDWNLRSHTIPCVFLKDASVSA